MFSVQFTTQTNTIILMETKAIIHIADNTLIVLIAIVWLTFIYEVIKICKNGNEH